MINKETAVSIIIPTYNEAENIAGIVKRIIDALKDYKAGYEVLVVDDASSDNTAEIAERELGACGRVIRRVSDKKSLSLSVLDGIKQSKAEAIVVMDADGSHPPELIPVFLDELKKGNGLIIASRYVKGGGSKGFPFKRRFISAFACLLGKLVTRVNDNTSGFFCISKPALEGVELTPDGFKIGLEIFVKARYSAFKEIPYIFSDRTRGKSKLKLKVVAQYLSQIIKLMGYKMFSHKRKS